MHVLEAGDPAVENHLLLRDQLRRSREDRALYAEAKRALAAQDWPDMNAYSDAKTAVIEEIKSHARAYIR
ncbi:GrpB family protein [Demequina subtropica]|uniref:GrpB family protein n=1 Tax=Demequina subtropica TaxID=1638989 RepID=UPI0007859767|nr:GrpB family protein [Demequina subtropica]